MAASVSCGRVALRLGEVDEAHLARHVGREFGLFDRRVGAALGGGPRRAVPRTVMTFVSVSIVTVAMALPA